MNREILFKAKRVDNGEWIEGNLLDLQSDTTKNMYYIIPRITNGCFIQKEFSLKFISPCYAIDPNTLCQYTGLTDKNGNEIWENDIVKLPNETLNKIDWDADSAKFALTDYLELQVDFDYYSENELEVMGNVFDNPELLEVWHESD